MIRFFVILVASLFVFCTWADATVIYAATGLIGDESSGYWALNYDNSGSPVLDFSLDYWESGGFILSEGSYTLDFSTTADILSWEATVATLQTLVFKYPDGSSDGAQGWDDCWVGVCLTPVTLRADTHNIEAAFVVPGGGTFTYPIDGVCCEVDSYAFYAAPCLFLEFPGAASGEPYTLTLSSVPEPSGWAEMAWIFLVGIVMRCRRPRLAAYLGVSASTRCRAVGWRGLGVWKNPQYHVANATTESVR